MEFYIIYNITTYVANNEYNLIFILQRKKGNLKYPICLLRRIL